eukprot:scaffold124931_cov39-Phaeocystis_antarctica.AAC.1
MFTHTKKEVDCSPGASTEEKKATDHASGKRKEQKKQKKKQDKQTPPPATAEKNKIKQPHIRLALSRAGTLTAMDSAPKRKRSGITPDSCGKAGDPHNLEGGALASHNSSISINRRRALDAGWDLAAEEAGSNAADAILAA